MTYRMNNSDCQKVRTNMDLRIKIIKQPMEIPERDADKLEKEIQGRMNKDYWDDHIRESTKMVGREE